MLSQSFKKTQQKTKSSSIKNYENLSRENY